MKVFRLLLAPCLFLAVPLFSFSQLYFVENKGQWDQQVHFKTEAGNSAFFLTKDGYSILINHPEDYQRLAEFNHGHGFDSLVKYNARATAPEKMRAHAFRVKFLGGNFNSKPIMEKPLPGVENYFIGSDPSKWASECKLYQAITYKNVYPNIDVRYYVQDDQLKYDVVVYPGADVSKIQMRYEGADKLTIRDNELVVGTSVGEARELKPYTYQFVNGKREVVGNKYKITGNTVSFDVKAYNKSTTLIIDPSLVFSSFSRSTADNWGFTATPGADGSFFGGGIAQPSGFPTTAGAIQGTGSGPAGSGAPPDIAIIKLSPDGRTRLYATYLGGNGLDQPHSLIADGAGNLVIAGRTNSGANFPGTLVGGGGGYDIFVTKINATGTAIIGSLRIGGTGDDGVNITATRGGANSLQRFYGDDGRSEVILDPGGNILLASSTRSTNFPTQNGFQTGLRGSQDAVILKINSNATAVAWSTTMGGDADDAGFVLSVNPLNPSNIYVAGGTSSNANFSGMGGGAVQGTYNGGLTDGYVAQLQDNGGSVGIVRATYLGTNNIDIVYGVQFDSKGFPYVMGITTGNWPVINAAYSVGNSRQFIAKLQPNLSAFVYSTTFGTSGAIAPNISPVAFLVDNCENVYVSGWGGGANSFGGTTGYPTSGTNGLPVTPDAFQRNTDGSDFYFFVLQKNAASQLYGSFFGQLGGGGGLEHVDGGTSRFDANGVIYQAMCANCKNVASGVPLSAPFPITAGVYGNTNPATGSGCNLGMVKIRFDLSGIDVALRAVGAKQLNFCLPATIQFTDTIREAKQYIWIWGDGTPNDTTTINPFTHVYNSTGTFNVKVIGIDSNSCNVKDSAFMQIRVTTDSVDVDFSFARQNCNSLTFQFTNTSDIRTASTPFGPRSFMWSWGDGSPNDTILGFSPPVSHTFPGIGSYDVRLVLIDSNYCNLGDADSIVNFQVIDNIRAGFSISSVCVPDTISVIDTSLGALTYLWVSSDGQQSTDALPAFVYNTPGTYSITQYIYNPNSCNAVDSTTRTFLAVGPPTAGFIFNPNPSQENTPTRFTSTASDDVVSWLWDFGDGDTSILRDPIHQYTAPGINTVCQTVTNAAGCIDSVCIPVESIINVVNDLPSAFTPNGDGVNDFFFVRGFGITKMTLRVYNRQGLMVFESRSQNIGWDGTYKGTPQPMDAYAWTLEVEYFTGEKFRKKGDVTLIR
jgi:gliding motility-associated-like protein